ncbi:MAG: PAS-domain containing protein [Alsobacter sp.]
MADGGLGAGSRWAKGLLSAGALLGSTALTAPASAMTVFERIWTLPTRLEPNGAVGLAVVMGLVIFATTTALIHLNQRRRWADRDAGLLAENAELRARNDRADLLLGAEPQIIVAFGGPSGEPEVEGDLTILAEGSVVRRPLAFGSWLAARDAQAIEEALERLKSRGEAFCLTLKTHGGRMIEADGRPVMGRAVLRLRDISGDRLELLRVQEAFAALSREVDGLKAILDAVPQPMWVRDTQGQLSWVNAAYSRAVEAADGTDAVTRGIELLDRPLREDAVRSRVREGVYRARVPAVVEGERRVFDVVDINARNGSVGVATDMSELEAARQELQNVAKSHAATLDQIPTAVAIFDGAKRLKFCNAAYVKLWQLDAAFLDTHPTDGEILDRLRNARRLPEQADYRGWKSGLMEAYRSLDTKEHAPWYLPDGRTLRVVSNPNPDGGITYLFDDVTERFHLETQFNALMRVQGETLDTLKEGVAVFGTDGRLKLNNPAFSALWMLPPSLLAQKPHIDAIVAKARELYPDDHAWMTVRNAIAGFHDTRQGFSLRMERLDGAVLDCAAAPLPDGATLLTFVDVTASVNVERALTERNEALEKAGELRESFVHHVSYELRSPLTNVIGFTQLLAEGTVGPLNERQREYAGHIMRSSAALMAIIDDILDLATIDTGEMELTLGSVDIQDTIRAAIEGVQDRIADTKLKLEIDVPASIGAMIADGKRVRQVLFNLLSNAIGFSREGQTVTVSAQRTDKAVMFSVRDQGRGIPADLIDRVFNRFESHTHGSTHRGVGLGLSIVRSFVELHGGSVDIESKEGAGTVVTCTFPSNGVSSQEAAE